MLDLLELDDVAVVGHDSGGMIARHAVAGDARVRALGLIDTEQSHRPELEVQDVHRRTPDPRLRRRRSAGSPGGRGFAAAALVLGDAFVDRSLLDGEFDEFFLQPLHTIPRAS